MTKTRAVDTLRRGRPAKVRAIAGGKYAVFVKNHIYTFALDMHGNLRPSDTRNGNADDRNYAKQLVLRQLEPVED